MSDSTSPWVDSPYYQQAWTSAQAHNINPQFFVTQIGQESSFIPTAQNGNATGIAQFMPSTAMQYGIDANDPNASLYAASAYDSDLLQQCGGDYVCMAQHYGTLPKSGKLSSGQQKVYDAAIAANTQSGFNTSFWSELACAVGFSSRCNGSSADELKMLAGQIGEPTDTNGNPQLSGTDSSCAPLDIICGFKKSGANILGMLSGLILLTIGLMMLKDNAGLHYVTGAAKNYATGKIRLAKAAAEMVVA